MSKSFLKIGSGSGIAKVEAAAEAGNRADIQKAKTHLKNTVAELGTLLRKVDRMPAARRQPIMKVVSAAINTMIDELYPPKTVQGAIRKATKTPSQVLTGRGAVNFSVQAAAESARQAPQVPPQSGADRAAQIQQELNQLLALVAAGAYGQDLSAIKTKIGDLTIRLKMMEAQSFPRSTFNTWGQKP